MSSTLSGSVILSLIETCIIRGVSYSYMWKNPGSCSGKLYWLSQVAVSSTHLLPTNYLPISLIFRTFLKSFRQCLLMYLTFLRGSSNLCSSLLDNDFSIFYKSTNIEYFWTIISEEVKKHPCTVSFQGLNWREINVLCGCPLKCNISLTVFVFQEKDTTRSLLVIHT